MFLIFARQLLISKFNFQIYSRGQGVVVAVQKQMGLCEFEASLVSRARTTKATQRNPVSKNNCLSVKYGW